MFSYAFRMWIFFIDKVNLLLLKTRRSVIINGKVKVFGSPDIYIDKRAKLFLADNVTLNSRDKWYHARMYSVVKILIDRPNAEVSVGKNTRINAACIHATKKISIGENCLIAANVCILDCNGHSLSFPNFEDRIHSKGKSRDVVIEDNVWIGMNSIILPGVTVGNGAVISANSVVSCDIPSASIFSSHTPKISKLD